MHLSRQKYCWLLRCSWSIACRRCSNYIFIINLTHGLNVLGRDSCKTRRETFMFGDWVRLILDNWVCVIKLWTLGEWMNMYWKFSLLNNLIHTDSYERWKKVWTLLQTPQNLPVLRYLPVKWARLVKPLCILIFDIIKIRPKYIFGPLQIQIYLLCLAIIWLNIISSSWLNIFHNIGTRAPSSYSSFL